MSKFDSTNNLKNDLPTGWMRVKLGEVCKTTSGGTPSRSIGRYYTGNIPWVKSGELNYNVIETTEEKISEEAMENSSAKIIPKGTLLIAMYGATVGRLAILGVDAATNQAVCAFENSEFIARDYLYHYLFFSKEKLLKQRIGGAQPNISQTIINALDFPLAPVPEQHRIVEKLERLFARLTRAEAALAAAEAALERYRQSVLNTAFKAEDEEGNLKDGWKWVKLGDLKKFSIYGPRFSSDAYADSGIPILRTTDIDSSGKVNLETAPKIKLSQKEIEKYRCHQGDFLITRTGSIGTLAVFKDQLDAIPGAFLIQYRVTDSINVDFLYHYLKSDFSQKYLIENSTGIGRLNLNVPTIDSLIVPLPDIKIQKVIVSEIETYFSRSAALLDFIEKTKANCERLRQSILQEAFGGRLVPQLEGDESAEVLLRRIKEAKHKIEKKSAHKQKT